MVFAITSENTSAPAQPLPSINMTFRSTELGDMAARATFLALFIIFGFVGNCVLLATLAQSHRLKGSALNLFMINLAVTNILDCLLNLPLILGATITEQWDYGQVLCRLNSFGVNLISVVVCLALLLMVVDRTVAVKRNDRYGIYLSTFRSIVLIAFMWLIALAFCVPLAANLISSVPFYDRYLCAVANGTSLIYTVMTSFCCYFLPLLTILLCYVMICCKARKEKKEKAKKKLFSHHSLEDQPLSSSPVMEEVNTSKYVLVLIVCWIIIEGPYLLVTFINQVQHSNVLMTSYVVLNVSSWPLDVALTWIKLSFPIYLPITTFCWQKEVWQRFKNFILCRKSNLIKDSSPRPSPRSSTNLVAMDTPDTNPFEVPVLFATADGLHYKTYGKQTQEEYESDAETYIGHDTQITTVDAVVSVATKCDVYGSQDLLQQHDADTSDYDSQGEIDPYSNSNPISVRTEYQRQGSQAIDLATKEKAEDNEAFEDNEEAKERHHSLDSGVDSINNTSEKKKRRSHPDKIDSLAEETPVEPPNEQAEEDISTRSEQTSQHDSGRGSTGGSTERKKKKRRPKLASDEETEPKQAEIPTQPEVLIQPEEVNYESIERKKKKKKKKKKEKPAKEDVALQTLPLSESVIKPPVRLEPLDHTERPQRSPQPMPRPSRLPNLAKEEDDTAEPAKPNTRSEDKTDRTNKYDKSEKHKKETNEKIDSDKSKPRPLPRRTISQVDMTKTAESGQTRRTASQGDSGHEHHSTTDSQTVLLSSSNNSTDLSEVFQQPATSHRKKRRKEKAKQEVP